MKGVETAWGKPERGLCLRDFQYVTLDGERRRLSDFKGRYNLALIFTSKIDDTLLDAIAGSYAEFQLRDARVLAVLKCEPTVAAQARDTRHWPFEVAVDTRGVLGRELGAETETGAVGTAVFITDRWAEVFFACRTVDGDPAPDLREVLDWLTFVDHQCPECFPSEWGA